MRSKDGDYMIKEPLKHLIDQLINRVDALNRKIANTVLKNIGNMNDAALDALTTAGIYYCWITNDSTCPTKGQWSFLVVSSPDSTHCSQFVVSGQPPWKSGVRYMSGNTWSSWDSKTT